MLEIGIHEEGRLCCVSLFTDETTQNQLNNEMNMLIPMRNMNVIIFIISVMLFISMRYE